MRISTFSLLAITVALCACDSDDDYSDDTYPARDTTTRDTMRTDSNSRQDSTSRSDYDESHRHTPPEIPHSPD